MYGGNRRVMDNLLSTINMNVARNLWEGGVGRYTQANCEVTFIGAGIRVYRPANLVHNSSTMHNMWGGVRLKPNSQGTGDILTKGHTYIFKFHAIGKSSNATSVGDKSSCGFSCQMGWDDASWGISPNPTNVTFDFIPANFNGEKECYYKFTVNDDVRKVCTKTGSSFVQGNTYLSYNDLGIGWTYTNTGELGTDVIFSNFRLYDITNSDAVKFDKTGVTYCNLFEDNYNSLTMYKDKDITTSNIIEM